LHVRLRRLACPGLRVQRFGRDVGTIRPGNGPHVKEEPLEVPNILERGKDWTFQPRGEVNRAFYPVIEDEMNLEPSPVFGSDGGRQCSHSASSVERGNPIECFTGLDVTPVHFEFCSMQYCPFFDEADSRAGTNPASEQFPVKGERRQLARYSAWKWPTPCSR
jgi:hypothetical protein